MNTALWIIQGVLAAAFLMIGGMKLMMPKAQLAGMGDMLAWTHDFTEQQIKGIGILEVLGAIGIILPPLVGILPILSPLAALGLTLVGIGAVVTHIRRNETQLALMPGMLAVLALFVVIGRFILLPY